MNAGKARARRNKPKSDISQTHQKALKPGQAARQVATTLLTRVIDDGRGLDGLLDTRHGPASWRSLEAADQALVRAIVTTALRHRGEIDAALAPLLDRKLPKNARHLIHSLHGAAAQILFMDIPDSAAVNLAVENLRNDERSTRFASLANAVLRRLAREKDRLLNAHTPEEKARLNVPPWLWKRLRRDYGRDRALEVAAAHMHEPVLDITVQGDPLEWAGRLNGVVLFGNSLRVLAQGPVNEFPGFEEGAWWVQDAAASLPAHLMGDVAGRAVLDLCAAPGGKTAQLCAAGAKVTALEQSADRLDRLSNNLQRLKLEANLVNADLFAWKPDHLFDAVLLDAPCSSTGTIRRHPDVQWTKSEKLVDELAALQKAMLLQAATFVKPGGILVFSNCSIDRAEGENVVAQILKSTEDHKLELDRLAKDDVFGLEELITGQGTLRSLPSHLQSIEAPQNTDPDVQLRFGGLDGFFAARFRKKS